MKCAAVIAQNRKIRAASNILRMLFFLHFEPGHSNDVVVLQRKLNRLLERHMPGRSLTFLCGHDMREYE
jgi:hypothetical protein